MKALLAVAAVALWAAPAAARQPMETIVQDDPLVLHQPDEKIVETMARLKSLGVDRVRVTAGWSVIAPAADERVQPLFDAADPNAYPAGRWRNLDRAVRLAKEAGLDVMIDIAFWAPLWATEDTEPGRATTASDAARFAEFTRAVVTRYSGSFVPPPDVAAVLPPSGDGNLLEQLFGGGNEPTPPPPPPGEPLPRVSWWTIWNEPNYPGFLQPQWTRTADGFEPASPHLYRRLVEASYPVIKELQPNSVVLVGGTSSAGAIAPTSEADGVPPLRFLRELACVDDALQPLAAPRCEGYEPLPGDGWSHHPYSLSHTPDFADPKHPDNLPIGALDRLTSTLDALVASGRVSPGLADVYLTEFGYETNPPDPNRKFNLDEQAQFLAWSEHIAWKNPRVRSWPQFLLRDQDVTGAGDRRGPGTYADWQTGLEFFDGTDKPSMTGFRLAFFAECGGPPTRPFVRLWGRVRPGERPHRVGLSAMRKGSRRRLASTRARPRRTGRPRPSIASFLTGWDGAFVRYAPYREGERYQFQLFGADGAESSLTLAPLPCGRKPGTRGTTETAAAAAR